MAARFPGNVGEMKGNEKINRQRQSNSSLSSIEGFPHQFWEEFFLLFFKKSGIWRPLIRMILRQNIQQSEKFGVACMASPSQLLQLPLVFKLYCIIDTTRVIVLA